MPQYIIVNIYMNWKLKEVFTYLSNMKKYYLELALFFLFKHLKTFGYKIFLFIVGHVLRNFILIKENEEKYYCCYKPPSVYCIQCYAVPSISYFKKLRDKLTYLYEYCTRNFV